MDKTCSLTSRVKDIEKSFLPSISSEELAWCCVNKRSYHGQNKHRKTNTALSHSHIASKKVVVTKAKYNNNYQRPRLGRSHGWDQDV